jgi:hypothetical protein
LDEAAAVVECERKAENALAEANSCYMSRRAEEDKPFSFRKAERRKRYDESGQSSEFCPAQKPTTLAARLLKKQCLDLYDARSAFKDRLSGDPDVRL